LETRPPALYFATSLSPSPHQTLDGERVAGWIFAKGKRDAIAQALGLGADAAGAAASASSSSSSSSSSAAAMPGSPPGSPARALAAAGGGGIAVFESASGEFMLIGNTYKLKDEIKALGASWVSGWSLPAAKRAEAEKLIARAAPPPASADSKRAREEEVKREGEGDE